MGQRTIIVAAIVAACAICYHNSIYCGFVFDDISAIKDNKDLRPTTPLKNIFHNDFWGTSIRKEQSHKSYRPLCVLTFRWNYWLHELRPAGYHVVNVILHMIVCYFYYRVCHIFLPHIASAVAALLFAVHPIHTEAVTGVVGRAELLSSVFFLLAFLSYIKATKPTRRTNWLYLFYFVLCVTIAMFSKEQGITITGVCVVYELLVVQNILPLDYIKMIHSYINKDASSLSSIGFCWKVFRRVIFLTALTILLLLIRLNIMGTQLPVFTRFDNPASVADTPSRQLTYNYLLAVNLWLVLFPCELCCDWTMGTIPLVESLADARNLVTVSTYFMLFAALYKILTSSNRQYVTIMCMVFSLMAFPFLPASNLFFPVGFVIAERVLYMPSMGFCMLVAYGFYLIYRRMENKKVAAIMLAVILIPHAIRTYRRNWDWETEYSIFMSGLKVNQRNAKLFNNVGHALENSGDYTQALVFFKKAVEVQNDDVGAYINVGRTYNHLKMFDEAEAAYLKAKSLLPKAKPGESYQARIAPNHLNVFLNLANLISRNHTRLEEADLLYRQAISMRADYTQAYINRGDVLMKLNRTEEAREVYERALLYESDNADIYYNLGVVYLEQGKTSQALAYLNKALELNSNHEQALLNSAIVLQELGSTENRKEARIRLFKLLEINDTNERVHFNLGMLAMDEHNIDEAEQWFKRAVHLKHDFRSALFNLALLLADDKRPLEAAPFLNQLVKYHPNHVKGLILLGDIYINNIKDLDAAENCYKRILELDPKNIQGLHNLCVVHVERGKLAKALDCLRVAHSLASKEDYILRHLKIVESRLQKIKQTPGTNREKELALSDYDPNEFRNLRNLIGGGNAQAGVTEEDTVLKRPKPITQHYSSATDDS